MRKIRVASRASKLALTQTQMVINLLSEKTEGFQFEIIKVQTAGDKGDLSVVGAFTSAIEQALIKKEADIAIHSYKDLPNEMVDGLTIASTPKRADARDVFISNSYNTLNDLPGDATIGTGSPRRKAQLLAINPNWNVKFINGNIDTRIQKLQNNNYDAIILAAAGLIRLGWANKITQYIEIDQMIPAPAQGALAIQSRTADKAIIEMCQLIHCKETALSVNTERKILSGIGGGCQLPIGSYVNIGKNNFNLAALFGNSANHLLNKINVTGMVSEIETLTQQAIEQLKNNHQHQ